MNRSSPRALLVIAAVVSACGGERHRGSDASAPTSRPALAAIPITTASPSASANPAADGAAGAPMDPLIEPEIHAQIRPTTVASGKSPTLLVTVKNPGNGFLFVPDPERGGDAMQIHLTSPSGEALVVSPGTASAGVDRGGFAKPMLADAKILPGETTTFDVELAKLAPVAAPGRYAIFIDYAWSKTAPRWRSPDLSFTVTPR